MKWLAKLVGSSSQRVEVLPPERYQIEQQRLGRFEAWLVDKQQRATNRVAEAEIEYVRLRVSLRRELMALAEANFERALQEKRHALFPLFVEEQEHQIMTRVEKAKTAYHDAVAHEATRVVLREAEHLEAQQRRANAQNALLQQSALVANLNTEGRGLPPGPTLNEREASEFEAELERELAATGKKSDMKKKLDEDLAPYGGYEKASPEQRAYYDAHMKALDKVMKRLHIA